MSRLALMVLALAAGVWASSLSGAAGTSSGSPTRATALGTLATGPASDTVTKTFWPRADARVEEATPTTNYGGLTKLGVRGGATLDIETFLRFGVTGVYGPVLSATLTLRTASWSDAGTIDGPALYGTTATWSETGISWSNRPQVTTGVLDDTGPIAVDAPVSYDATQLVRGDGAYGFGLAASTGDGSSFHSRESAVQKPRLVVTFLDDQPPSPPSSLQASVLDSTSSLLDWEAATDDVGVTGYEIFRDGASLARIGTETSYVDSTLLAGGRHTYTVRALDTVGSKSAPSNGATVTTPITLTFEARADARLEEANPATNYGSLAKLAARGGAVPDIESLVRFRVTGVSGPIHSATLSLRTGNWSDAGTNDGPALYRTTSGWTEQGVSWSNRPPRTSGVIDDQGALGPDSLATYDVEPVVQGDGIYSFILATSATDAVYFHSREAPAARPVLEVSFFPPEQLAMAAGDIACDPGDADFNAGQGTATACRQLHTSDLLVAADPDAVLPLGDLQYGGATLAQFMGSYDPSWGRVKDSTYPAAGNHEYKTSGAVGYFDYFNGPGNATGRAGDRTKGYYSYNIGAWHLVALNSECSRVGGCDAGTPQEQWLRQDLASNARACTLAYLHHPRFSSGNHGNTLSTHALWQALWEGGAEIVLSGHSHDYERFARQNPSAVHDPAHGIRQFVVGTGGNDLKPIETIQPNSEVREAGSFGVLALTLRPGSYAWQFRPAAGSSFTDSGASNCHQAPSP